MEERPVYSKPTFPPRSLRHLSHAPRHPVRHFALSRAANGVSPRARYSPPPPIVSSDRGIQGRKPGNSPNVRFDAARGTRGSTKRRGESSNTAPRRRYRPDHPHVPPPALCSPMTSPGEPSNVARQVLVQEGENENGNCMMLTQPTVNPPQFRQLTRNPRRKNPRPAGRGPADLTSSALEKQTDSAMAKVYFGPEYTYGTRRISTRDTFIVPSTRARHALADPF